LGNGSGMESNLLPEAGVGDESTRQIPSASGLALVVTMEQLKFRRVHFTSISHSGAIYLGDNNFWRGKMQTIAMQSAIPRGDVPRGEGEIKSQTNDFLVPSVSLDPMVMESMAINMEASLRIYTDHHFFSWTQGLLQNLVQHELLICALPKGESDFSLVESYSTAHSEPKAVSGQFIQEASLADMLIKNWEANRFLPVMYDIESSFSGSVLMRELSRIGANYVITHGTHDANARMTSFFLFACKADDANTAQARRIELLVHFLYGAWVRTKISLIQKRGEDGSHSANRDILTRREQEVLQWVYLGKSNIEIGIILGISPLTVKNHVQEILRRLNVQNRTQAVGKAFNLHILTC